MAEKKNPYAGTQTEKNLLAALAGESEATNKYTYFASRAKKDGYEQIAALFLKTASNEREHAKLWFKELFGIGTTAENLLSAAEGENYEWTDTCTRALLRRPRKRASRHWQRSSASSQRSRNIMRSAIAPS